MSLHRHAARRDENEHDVIAALEAAGAVVERLSGTGIPDLLVAFRGRMLLLEVIGPGKAAKYRRTGGLTPAQVTWHQRWPVPVERVRTVPEALAAIRAPYHHRSVS